MNVFRGTGSKEEKQRTFPWLTGKTAPGLQGLPSFKLAHMLAWTRVGLSARDAGEEDGDSWENTWPLSRIEMQRSARKKRYFFWFIEVSVRVGCA
jgi:hypothetical protein